ncbi:uncharacterized protein LOC6642483 [Drosophila willistoni]|nr:uncharacterized protein LOC6642483 [Drosophila willistoni]
MAIAVMAFQIDQTNSLVEFTNLKCIPIDKEFAGFEYCQIKAINRTYKYISLKVNLFKKPVTKISVNISALKRLNGYKPFLYNITFDACKFLASKNKNSVINYFYNLISSHSNMNHTCPYNDDLILEKLTTEFLNYQLVTVLPVPEGQYALFTSWYAYGIKRAEVQFYVKIS